MRGLRMMVVAVACAGSMAAAHGQIGGDEPGGHGTPNPPSAPAKLPGPVRVSGGVMAGLILTRVPPSYPADARKDGVEGQVVMHALIGKDGHIKDLTVISGPEKLRGAATDAVRQWTYKPYLLNGEPREVDTTIIVNFNLGSSAQSTIAPHRDTAPAPKTIKMLGLAPGAVQGPPAVFTGGGILSRVPPVYPPVARAAKVEGAVVVKAIIAKDGTVRSAEAVSGPEILRGAAVDAVRQWTFNATLRNGEAAEAMANVTVTFALRRKPSDPQASQP
ncbi:MAG TPA: TonB family protein [Acidobacteriaceae bacterium]|nr:TonB family protein [Acidobacteriaceae bacterium]